MIVGIIARDAMILVHRSNGSYLGGHVINVSQLPRTLALCRTWCRGKLPECANIQPLVFCITGDIRAAMATVTRDRHAKYDGKGNVIERRSPWRPSAHVQSDVTHVRDLMTRNLPCAGRRRECLSILLMFIILLMDKFS